MNRHHAAEASLAALKVSDGFEQVYATEVGPENVGHVDFRIRRLPQKEVAEPHFSTGANHQVELRQMARIQMFRDQLLIDLEMVDATVVLAPRR